MAFTKTKRTFNRRYKKRYTRKRSMKRQMLAPKMGGRLRQPIHYFTRFADEGVVSTTANQGFTTGSIYFDLSTIPGYGEFTALYDFFKIKAVKVTFVPISNVNIVYTGDEPAFYYRFYSCIDYNDRTVPASINVIREYGNCKFTPGLVLHKRFLHPKPVMTVDEDSTSGGNYGLSQGNRDPWIATASNQCEYYGVKYGFEHANQASVVPAYRCELKYYLAFKGKL